MTPLELISVLLDDCLSQPLLDVPVVRRGSFSFGEGGELRVTSDESVSLARGVIWTNVSMGTLEAASSPWSVTRLSQSDLHIGGDVAFSQVYYI